MKTYILFGILSMMAAVKLSASPPIEEGKAIFNSRCATCHNINKTAVGPALAGIDERRSFDWIVKFVQSSQTFIKTGDEQAVAVFTAFNGIPMPDHTDLTADNIRDIVTFIKSQSKPAEASTAPFARPAKIRPAYVPVKGDDYVFFGGLFLSIALLVFALLMLVRVKEIQRRQYQAVENSDMQA